MIAPV
jgi:hypothetical protein